MNKLKRLMSVLVIALIGAPWPMAGQAEGKAFRIGVFFWHESPLDEMAFKGIKEGFDMAGITRDFDVRRADGKEDEAAAIIRDFAESPPDLIFALGTGAAKRLMKVIHDTPIVFTAVTNPVQSGITPNWETSGRNIAGNSNWIPTADILGHFKKIVSGMKTLGIMYNPDNPVSSMEVSIARKNAGQHGMALTVLEVHTADDLAPAARRLAEEKVGAIWVPIDILVYKNLDRIKPITVPARIPLLASSHRGVDDGAIYGEVVDYRILGQRSVSIAKSILVDGVAPKDIPVGMMRSHRYIVNLKAAEEIGFKIPLEFVAKAHDIIQ